MKVLSELFPNNSESNQPNAKHPTKMFVLRQLRSTSFLLPQTAFFPSDTIRSSRTMSQAKFLSGDKAGIDEFLERFDVSNSSLQDDPHD
jgi:hypothetical protein